MRFDIDLKFSVSPPPEAGGDTGGAGGTIKASGKTITVTTDSLSILPSVRNLDRRALNDFARRLKEAGICLVVEGPQGTIVNLGNVKSNLVSRIGTNSTSIKLGKAGASRALLARRPGAADLGAVGIPGTLFPLVPTVRRNYRSRPTTTHYARGGGAPRLIFVKDSQTWNGVAPRVLAIPEEGLEIGGAPGAGLVLPGLDPVHARIVHNDIDEYVLVAVGRVGGSSGLRSGESATLRSGARIEVGEWRILFIREEYADHGRPFGGRNGGELSFQRPQLNVHTGLVERDSSV